MKDSRIEFRIETSLKLALELKAKEEGISLSDLGRMIIKNYFKQEASNGKDFKGMQKVQEI
jgi:predicted HicB family RNase H-like nuclease